MENIICGMARHGHQTDAETSCWSFPAWAGRALAALGTAPVSWSGAGKVVNGAAMARGIVRHSVWRTTPI